MKKEDILNLIKSLANSQGFYSNIYDIIQNEPEKGEYFLNQLESLNFKDPIDLILYLEG